MTCTLPRTTCEADVRALCVPSRIWMRASDELEENLYWPLLETARGILDACYDRGSTFGLFFFLNFGTP